MSKKFRKEVKKLVESMQFDDFDMFIGGGGHLQVEITINGKTRRVSTSATPSCHRVLLNFKSKLRHTKAEMMET